MKKIKVLIVDDSSVMRKMVERSLRQAGVNISEVFEANNGMEALSLVRQNALDLVLSDINMPVMDGLEFIRQLQAVDSARGVPVVMITTEGSASPMGEALLFGARGYITKPFTPDQIKEQVFPLLEG